MRIRSKAGTLQVATTTSRVEQVVINGKHHQQRVATTTWHDIPEVPPDTDDTIEERRTLDQ